MITLQDPEEIELSNKAFRNWMCDAGFKIEELDARHNDIKNLYGPPMRQSALQFVDDVLAEHYQAKFEARESDILDLKMDIIGLKMEMQAVMHLWGQLRDEMS